MKHQYQLISIVAAALVAIFFCASVAQAHTYTPPYPNLKMAVIVINFPDHPTKPWTSAELAGTLFTDSNSVATLYNTVSGGRMTVSGDIYDRGGAGYELARPDKSDGTCDWAAYYANAVAAAAADIDYTKYNVIFLAAPRIICSTGGKVGGVDIPGTDAEYLLATVDGDLDYSPHHELGHLFGMEHANAWVCTPAATLKGNCVAQEYSDRFSVMGLSRARMLTPAGPHLENRGWLEANDVQTITTDGDYVIRPVEIAGSQPRYLKIPQARSADGAVTSWYWIEYRQPIGFDNIPLTPTIKELGVTDGALVHLQAVNNERYIKTLLLDMTPGQKPSELDIFKPALPTGSAYTDKSANVSFGVLSRTSTTMTIRVRFSTKSLCVRHAPSITTKAVKGSGRPGQQLRYTITVTNRDVLCGPRAIELRTIQKPSGWTATLNKAATYSATITSGAKTSFDVRVTSLKWATRKTYALQLEARQKAAPTIKTRVTLKPIITR